MKSSQLFFVNIYKYVAGALATPPLDIYQRGGSMAELELVNSRPPALAAGENSAFFKEIPQRVLAFHASRETPSSPGRSCSWPAFSTPMVCAICSPGVHWLVHREGALALGSQGEVQNWAQAFQTLPEATLKRCKELTIPAYAELKNQGAAQQYAEAVELVGLRAGLLMAGDLDAAARAIGDAAEGVVHA